MYRLLPVLFVLAIHAGCTEASGHREMQYAAQCDELLGEYADPAVFTGLEEVDSHARIAALAFEHEVAVWRSGTKDGARPDFELVVQYTDESDGFECDLIGLGGYAVASLSTFGGAKSIDFARRADGSRIAVMERREGTAPAVRLYLDVKPDGQNVARLYPTEMGEIPASGITVATHPDESVQLCDHRSGTLWSLAPNGAIVEFVYHGCENLEAEEVYSPEPPQSIHYDEYGNVFEELWTDDDGRTGRTEYRNTPNDRGDWIGRELLMKTATTEDIQLIRKEYRYIRYRSSVR